MLKSRKGTASPFLMAEKIFNARFAQKIDTLANWANSNIVLKAGEIAFATTAAATGSGLTEPVIIAKIGDGSKTFNQLEYSFYAKASDVYGWAKKDETAHRTDLVTWFPTSVEGLTIVDGNLQATKRDGTTYSLPLATDAELEAAINAVNAKIGDLTALDTEKKTNLVEAINEVRQAVEVGGTGSVVEVGKAHNDVNKQTTYTVKQGGNDVAEAIIVPDAYDDTALAEKVAANETAIANETTRATGAEELLGERLTATEGVANSAKSAIDAFLNENAVSDNVVNTLKEIQEGLDAGEESAASLLAEINKLKDGTTPAGKATADADGNVITTTYVKDSIYQQDLVAINQKHGDLEQSLTDTNTTISGIDERLQSAEHSISLHGDIVTHNVSEFATAAQGAKADTAVQPEALKPVATSGKLSDLDATFGEGVTDIIFDAGNASGYTQV